MMINLRQSQYNWFNTTFNGKFHGVFISSVLLILSCFTALSQTTLINPTAEGGFELGATFTDNGWSTSSGTNNPWIVGTAVANSPITGNSAYITNDGGTTNAYTPANNATNFFWRDVTVPAGETKIQFSFNWAQQGEASWDLIQVFYAPTTVNPIGSNTHPGSGTTNVPSAITGATYVMNGSPQATVQTFTGFLPPSLAGTTFRLIFSWKNETGGTQPPAAIDNINLTSSLPGNFISAASGDWNVGSTWVGGTAPSNLDNATITTGHAVNINATGLGSANLTVDGTLSYTATPSSFAVSGNLLINPGGIFNAFNGTTGKTLNLAGNLTNNGTIDLSKTSSVLVLNGSTPQTVSGTGTFTSNTIVGLTFNNSSTTYPSITWGVNNIMVSGTNTFTNGRVAITGNWLSCGTASAAGTLSYTAGGIVSGTYGRGQSTATTGSSITAGSDPTTVTSRFPFINSQGLNRSIWFERTGPTGAGIIGINYSENASVTNVSISDANPAYTVDKRYGDSWTPSILSGTPTATSFELAIVAPNIFGGAPSVYPRLIQASSAIATNQTGTLTPCAQRGGLTYAELTSGSFYFGINNADVPNLSVASGDWSNSATWSKGSVPGCGETVTIQNGHTVTINTNGNNAKGVTINTGGTLTMTSGTLTTGCTDNNNLFSIAGGTFNMQGGTLTVNGKMQLTATVSGIFTQSGGDIIVDGNSGTLATSTPGHVADFYCHTTNTLQWTGGTFTVVDPTLSTNSTDRSFKVFPTIAHSSGPGWTLKFGNGISTQAGGHIDGFEMDLTNSNSFKIGGTVIVDVLTGTNRYVTTNLAVPLNNLTINSGEYRISSLNYISGNIVNNGTLTTTSTLHLSDFSGTTASVGTNAQTISGSGVFRNATSAPTANLTSLTINNNNSTGVTLQVPLSVSSTLTMTSGLINTTTTNILQLGTGAGTGTLSGTPSATNMIVGPFARNFPSSRTATGTYTNSTLFPVGKTSSYLPIHIDPTTTSGGPVIMSGEVFTSNSGTLASGLDSLGSNRWEALFKSGATNFTSTNIRLNDASLTNEDKIVQSSSAAGTYGSIIPVSTYASGSPNTLTTTGSQILAADFQGYFSYAELQVCNGTPNPGIATPSVSTKCAGQTHTMNATGLTPGIGMTYQWKFATTAGGPYANVSGGTGATTASYTTAALTAGTYYYIIESTCANGGATNISNEISLVVNPLPINMPSSNSPVCVGTTLTLVGNSDGNTFSWTGPNTFTSTNEDPTIANVTATASGTYTLTATSSAGCTSSNTTIVVVNNNPSFTVSATPSSICVGENSQLNVAVPSTGYVLVPSSGTYSPLSGATDVNNIEADDSISLALPIGFNFTFNGTTYTEVFASSNGWLSFNSNARSTSAANARSNNLTSPPSTMLPFVAPLWDDLDGSIAPGSARYLTSGSAPDRIFTFEWLNWEWNWQATSAVISYQVKLYENNGKIEFVYQQEAGSLSSPTASIGMGFASGNFISLNNSSSTPNASTTTETTNISTKPANGQVYGFIPNTNTYSWSPATYLNSTSIANPLATAVSSTIEYFVTVTNTANCSKIDSITVNATTGPVINSQPSSAATCLGKNAVFTVNAIGASLTYVWEESTDGGAMWNTVSNGGIYSGATTASLMLTGVTNTQNGYKYRVVLTSSCGTPVTSDGLATLSVNPNPTASLMPTGQNSICAPNTHTITTTTDIGDTYVWKKNNVVINGATSSSYIANTGGIYRAIISVAATGCKDSTVINDTLIVNAQPSNVTASASNNSICSGSLINLFGNVNTGGTGTVGAGLATEFANSPYRNGANASRQQYLFTVAELNSIGFTAGNINSIQFFVTSLGSPTGLTNYTIQIGHTTISNFGSNFENPSFTTVYSQASYTVMNGNNLHVFSTPFLWNGSDNIIIQICHEVTSPSSSSTVKADAVTGKSIGHIEFVAGNICGSNLTVTTGNRPNITFEFGSSYTFAWTSTPSGFNSSVQNPSGVGPLQTTTYNFLVTSSAGCTNTASTTVNVTGDMVMNGNNTGAESLRKVVECANATDTIYFDAGVTMVNLTDSLLLNKNLTLQGNAGLPMLSFNLATQNEGVIVENGNLVTLKDISLKNDNLQNAIPLLLNKGTTNIHGNIIVKGNGTIPEVKNIGILNINDAPPSNLEIKSN